MIDIYRKIILVLSFSVFSLLTACSNGAAIQAWAGVLADASQDTVFLAHQHNVFALQLSNGNIKWRFPDKEDNAKFFYASPALTSDNQLIIAGYDHKLYSLNPQNGQVNWTFEKAKGKFIAPPLVTENTIYASCADENLYAIDLNGNFLWSFHTAHAIWSKPIIYNNTLYLAAMDSYLYAINPSNGNLLWKKDMGGASVSTPTIDQNGNLFIGTFAKEILSFKADGTLRWKKTTDGWVWSSPAVHQNALFFGDVSGKFYSLEKDSGELLWQITPSLSPITSTPIITNNEIYFANGEGNFYAVDFKGKVLWSIPVGGKVRADLVNTGEQILIATDESDYILHAYTLDGKKKWSFSTPTK